MAISLSTMLGMFESYAQPDENSCISTARFFHETERHTIEATTGLTDCLAGWCSTVHIGKYIDLYICRDGSRVIHDRDSGAFGFYDVDQQYIGLLTIKIITLSEIES